MWSTVLLLVVSNMFMTLAWYGHLKYADRPLYWAILASWGLAFFEYVFQVPANRLGAKELSVTQLKILQECITLAVFSVIAWGLFGEPPRWNTAAAFACLVAAVAFAFWGG